jgi:hypothetical protein
MGIYGKIGGREGDYSIPALIFPVVEKNTGIEYVNIPLISVTQ